jgi:F-type H+-transporting ATPase subunit delta
VAQRGSTARRYAEAVFGLASESNALDAWGRDLRTIADFASEADVARVLQSGRVPQTEKLRLMAAGVERHVSPLAMNLVKLLASRNKLHLTRQIQTAFQTLADDRSGIAHATVTTAVALQPDEREAVASRLSQLTGKRVDVTPIVDESIIGGVVARIGDQLIDGSTRTRLVALKRRIAAAGGTT